MSSPTLALIPAKRHSVGVPDKNWKPLGVGLSCTDRALHIGQAVADIAVLSTDVDLLVSSFESMPVVLPGVSIIQRPHDLPDTMLAVVQHALEAVPGPDDEIVVLLQPSSPLRTSETVRKAIQMLEDHPDEDAVVSVSPSYPLEWSLLVDGGVLTTYSGHNLDPTHLPARRQDCTPTYKRDGVVYAFRRRVVSIEGSIYGNYPLPLHTPPSEALSIDTPEDWAEAVRRFQQPQPA